MLREGFGEILYVISVVGNDTYSAYTKIGVGKRPDATFWKTYRAKMLVINGIRFLGEIFY